jgi:hypothetical protein
MPMSGRGLVQLAPVLLKAGPWVMWPVRVIESPVLIEQTLPVQPVVQLPPPVLVAEQELVPQDQVHVAPAFVTVGSEPSEHRPLVGAVLYEPPLAEPQVGEQLPPVQDCEEEGAAEVHGHSRVLELLQVLVRVCVQLVVQEPQTPDVQVLAQVLQLVQAVVVTGAEPVHMPGAGLPALSSQV